MYYQIWIKIGCLCTMVCIPWSCIPWSKNAITAMNWWFSPVATHTTEKCDKSCYFLALWHMDWASFTDCDHHVVSSLFLDSPEALFFTFSWKEIGNTRQYMGNASRQFFSHSLISRGVLSCCKFCAPTVHTAQSSCVCLIEQLLAVFRRAPHIFTAAV